MTLFRYAKITGRSFADVEVRHVALVVWLFSILFAFVPTMLHTLIDSNNGLDVISDSVCLTISPVNKSPGIILHFSFFANIIIMFSQHLIIYCYVMIYRTAKGSRKQLEKLGARIQDKYKDNRQMIIFIFQVIVANFLSFTPFCVFTFLTVIGYQLPPHAIVLRVFVPVSSILNSWFYTLRTLGFKQFIQLRKTTGI